MPEGHRGQAPGREGHSDTAAAPNVPQATHPQAKSAAAPDVPNSLTTPRPASLPPSLLDKPAQPAKVRLFDGKLAIDAANSSLSAILEAIETTSGMSVDGLGKDQRVFGQYGPGTPRDVLSSLLDGAGYNFMMVGDTNSGAPREVILTQRNNAPLPPEQSSAQPQSEEDDQPTVYNNPPEEAPPPQRPSSVISPPGTPDADGRVRTPQEILQELQRMRAQQAQQPPQ